MGKMALNRLATLLTCGAVAVSLSACEKKEAAEEQGAEETVMQEEQSSESSEGLEEEAANSESESMPSGTDMDAESSEASE